MSLSLCELRAARVDIDGRAILHDIDLKVVAGERLAVIGRSGAGKSTLLNLIFQQTQADVALIPQGHALVNTLSVFHNVYAARLRQHSALYNTANLFWPRRKEVDKIKPLLEELGLEEKLFERAGQLSGGQQQRTAVARALHQNAEIALADEPVSAVDQRQAHVVLKAINSRYTTTVLAMHDIELALQYADRIVGLRDGTITLDTPASRLEASALNALYSD